MNTECKVENLRCTCFYETNNLTSDMFLLVLIDKFISKFMSGQKKPLIQLLPNAVSFLNKLTSKCLNRIGTTVFYI